MTIELKIRIIELYYSNSTVNRYGFAPLNANSTRSRCHITEKGAEMEESLLKTNVANNLVKYRKACGMTQAELAQKINYSDKSVSKWERGDGLPDVFVLCHIAELFGVTVNELVYAQDDPAIPASPVSAKVLESGKRKKRVVVTMLACGVVWLVAAIAFVLTLMLGGQGSTSDAWLVFVYAVPACAIVFLVLSILWFGRSVSFWGVSLLTWSLAASIHLTLLTVASGNVSYTYLIYIISAVFQLLVVLWYILRALPKLDKIFGSTENK